MNERAVVVADADGVIRSWNDGAASLFGHSAVAAIGAKLDLIVPPEYRARHWHGFHAAVAAGKNEPNNVANVPVLKKDGTIGRFAVHLIVLTDAFGGGAGAVGVFAPLPADGGGLYPL